MKYLFRGISYLFYTLALFLFGGIGRMMMGLDQIEVYPMYDTTAEYYEKQGEILGAYLICPLLAMLFFVAGIFFSSMARRHSRNKKSTLDYHAVEGPFILYLRSFMDDSKTKKRVSLLDTASEEEAVVQVMADIAPVYAIGDPRDKYMPNGASRIYVDDAHWKDAVRELSQKAVAVVLRLGETDSFWWEVKMTIENNLAKKLLFIIPSTDTFKDVSTLYRIMNENGINLDKVDISIKKEDRGSIASFLYFDSDLKPQTSKVPSSRFSHLFLSYYDLMCNTLLPFRSKYGLTTRHTTIRKARIIQICVFIYLIFYTTVNLWLNLTILDSFN